tara:strand:+ start:132 stop:977 length:846 start_codon:yes stop_codon:yes gene_type:complete
MHNYFVIGNPIDHSLSPLVHNYWFRKYKINSTYEKKKLEENDLNNFIIEMRTNNSINGANVTVPFKNKIIPFLDKLTDISKKTLSVNTIYKENGKLIGNNTDAPAFYNTLLSNKSLTPRNEFKILIIGAGGVAPSILWAAKKLTSTSGEIYITNRTKQKAISLLREIDQQRIPQDTSERKINILDWGEIPDVNLVINTTSVGLIKEERLSLDFKKFSNNKNILFYDLIYNPKETSFLNDANKRGNKIMNGRMMFLLQAADAFYQWTKKNVEINDEVIKLLD